LSEQTILAAGIRSLAPGEWPRYLCPRLAQKVQSCYVIPYPDADGFYRVKASSTKTSILPASPRGWEALLIARAATRLRAPGKKQMKLHWADIDLLAGTITVGQPKRGPVRRVPVNSVACAVLVELGARRQRPDDPAEPVSQAAYRTWPASSSEP